MSHAFSPLRSMHIEGPFGTDAQSSNSCFLSNRLSAEPSCSTEAMVSDWPWNVTSTTWRALTFEVRGGRKWAKPACGRPLDRRVRPVTVTRCVSDHDQVAIAVEE